MVGPTTQGLDTRVARANVAPYTGDNWTDFHADNSRIVILPLVNWRQTSKNGRADIEIKGFAAFYITRYDAGQVYGRFVRLVTQGTVGPGDTTFDAGLYSAKLSE